MWLSFAYLCPDNSLFLIGFEISLGTHYIATSGLAWLERGGVYVEANIRGGGEFGPKWHQAVRAESVFVR